MMCEPQVFGLRAGSSLAKMPSDGRAGGPRLGLDTSLMYTKRFLHLPDHGNGLLQIHVRELPFYVILQKYQN